MPDRSMSRGDSFVFDFQVMQPPPNQTAPQNITGWSFWFTCKYTYVDPDNAAQMKNTEPCLKEVFKTVLDMQGTLSGEHGVGLEKRPFMSLEFNAATLDLMRRIKKEFDPNNILNPGKLLPD